MSLFMSSYLPFTRSNPTVRDALSPSDDDRRTLPDWLRQVTEFLVTVGPDVLELLCLAFAD